MRDISKAKAAQLCWPSFLSSHFFRIPWHFKLFYLLFSLQVLSPCTLEDSYLHVPPLEKQFLISPPASPPVGWEQPKEDKPVVDYDLLAAMAQLAPGKCFGIFDE